MLYLVGLGLFDEKDISIKGLETLKKADLIYAEFFTSNLFGSSLKTIERLIGKEIIVLNREEVEEENIFFKEAKHKNVALITGGDPLIATTHSDFLVEAKNKGINTSIIHGSSILSSAPGISGLQAYKFGKVTTIPFPDENFFPHSPYLAIEENLKNNAHTLVLLDIQAHKNRYMSVNQGLEYLIKVKEELIGTGQDVSIDENTLAIGIARVGSSDVIVKADKIDNLLNFDFGSPLHCIVIPSKLHIVEAEYLIAIAGADNGILQEYY
ncbi:diphthine synthase [Methanobrevibacter filiformis]|uniref:Diphthine synthase n=1 Tax=Methanobrevibacter filiformis TaxID=55758 RepID=A0A166A9U3_9EURY|nr:diphthine synthase [Methanobrevibacter filiformis]KZX11763.1 diphthine synthase [Methanobrevibacter filiformis]